MAGGRERTLRRRIRSVQSTKKITRAMELIAASRIIKAQQRVEAARPYSEKITEVIHHLAAGGVGTNHPLLTPPADLRRIGFVVIAGDRGLCGAYNSSVIRTAERAMRREEARGRRVSLVTVGRKVESYFRFRGRPITRAFTGMSDEPAYEDARRIAEAVSVPFEQGELDRIELVYTRFVSAGVQEVTRSVLMPLDPGDLGLRRPAPTPAPTPAPAPGAGDAHAAPKVAPAYEFEPAAEEILSRLLPRYVEARLFAAQLDAAASQHAAQQRAMKAATDNAEELIRAYTRMMNRARQESITTEIMEIVGGAEALRSGAAAGGEDLLADTIEHRREALFTAHRTDA